MPQPVVQTIHRDPALLYGFSNMRQVEDICLRCSSYWILLPITVVMVRSSVCLG